MAAASHLLHHILHRHPPPAAPPLSPSPTSYSILKPLSIFSSVPSKTPSKRLNNVLSHHQHHHNHSHHSTATTTALSPYRSLLFCRTLSLASRLAPAPVNASPSLAMESELDDEEEVEEEDFDDDEEDEEDLDDYREEELEAEGSNEEREKEENMDKEGLHSLRVRTTGMELPSLSVKEKKELASYAHTLGKKLKSQLVGKSGVNSNVATSFVETLEANELLKIKIHRTCPGELEDVVKQLEELTCSVVVGKIGRTVILYRPSLTKLKAEEKKRQHQKMFLRRKLRARPAVPARGAEARFSSSGRRGSSRIGAGPRFSSRGRRGNTRTD